MYYWQFGNSKEPGREKNKHIKIEYIKMYLVQTVRGTILM